MTLLELLRLWQDACLRDLDALLLTDLAQARINAIEAAIEAARPSLFKSGWRPAADLGRAGL